MTISCMRSGQSRAGGRIHYRAKGAPKLIREAPSPSPVIPMNILARRRVTHVGRLGTGKPRLATSARMTADHPTTAARRARPARAKIGGMTARVATGLARTDAGVDSFAEAASRAPPQLGGAPADLAGGVSGGARPRHPEKGVP